MHKNIDSRKLGGISEEKIFELVERMDVRGPRYTSYPTVPVWKSDFPSQPFEDTLKRVAHDGKSIAVYLHLPFCNKRCLFCGCNSYITHDRERVSRYIAAIEKEIEKASQLLEGRVGCQWLHLGGGTPTHTPPDLLAELLDFLLARIPTVEGAELSVEVDPRVTTKEHLSLMVERGFRRISIGLQDLDPLVQKSVMREYSFEQMSEFIALCRATGFTSTNIDLIYGLPHQTRASWLSTLEQVVTLRPDRLACFGYAHLPEKTKHQRAIDATALPEARQRLGMLLDSNAFFTGKGYDAIGFDHFALPEDKLSLAQHNGTMWRNFMGYTDIRGLEMVGFGASSISEFNEIFVQNLIIPEDYNALIEQNNWAITKGCNLTAEDRIRKIVINDLMCNLVVRIPAEAYHSVGGTLESLRQAIATLKPFEAEGLIVAGNSGEYEVTEIGRLFLRNIAMPFDQYLPNQTGVNFSRTI